MGDIAFSDRNGNRLPLNDLREAHHIVIAIRGSKTDQARRGCTRALSATNASVDAVSALIEMFAARPDLAFADPLTPLFLMDNGAAVNSDTISGELKAVAEFLELDHRRFASHSLRRGGATAMAAAGIAPYVIRRWGRWLSDAYKTYIFGSSEELGDLATVMATANFSLAMSLEDFKASTPTAGRVPFVPAAGSVDV